LELSGRTKVDIPSAAYNDLDEHEAGATYDRIAA
jgi:hypothetical protein